MCLIGWVCAEKGGGLYYHLLFDFFCARFFDPLIIFLTGLVSFFFLNIFLWPDFLATTFLNVFFTALLITFFAIFLIAFLATFFTTFFAIFFAGGFLATTGLVLGLDWGLVLRVFFCIMGYCVVIVLGS